MMKKGLFGRTAIAVAVILVSTLIAWAQAGDNAANIGRLVREPVLSAHND